jgi:hypothetical protein
MNREDWLTEALPKLKELLTDAPDFKTPLISIGLPHARALSAKQKAIGECWSSRCTSTGQATIFISPLLDDPVEILGVLLHELIHASVGNQCGHRGAFARVARASGLVGKMTATTPGPELTQRLHALAIRLGDLPHARLNAQAVEDERKKQGTRQRLYECDGCGQKIRAATDTLTAHHIGEEGKLCGTFTLK